MAKPRGLIPWITYMRLAYAALEAGNSFDGRTIRHPITWGCEKPPTRQFWSFTPTLAEGPWRNRKENFQIIEETPEGFYVRSRTEHFQEKHFFPLEAGAKMWIDLDVPCRKCNPCLTFKRKKWAARAAYETSLHPRTWWVTLTFRPQARLVMSLRAGASWKYADLLRPIGREVTKFLKRIRKNTGKKIRYMVVYEPHKDGFPHVHLLIHEPEENVFRREIEREWRSRFGVVTIVLVDNGVAAAQYVTKYACKDMNGRVRASQKYGSPARTD